VSLQIIGTIGAGLFGAIIGSFLNVVIYRMPRDLSISNPRWSMCPSCGTRIRPYDNIPLIGWLWLRGRCRSCRATISPMYPLVEGLTALSFVTIWDALFVAQIHGDWANLLQDWPFLVAAWTLVAVLMAVSVMDIDAYMLDVRPLWFCMVVGAVMLTLWFALRGEEVLPRFFATATGEKSRGTSVGGLVPLPPALCLIGAVMGVVWVLTEFGRKFFTRADAEADVPEQIQEPEAQADNSPPTTEAGFKPWPVLLLASALAGINVWVLADGMGLIQITEDSGLLTIARGVAVCVILMAVIVLASLTHRPVDDEIIEEIEAERATARSMVLREFSTLLPALIAGAVLFAILKSNNQLGAPFGALPVVSNLSGAMLHGVGGLCWGITAIVGGAAVGWSVRIGGTLLFGKEAFGSGDIFILAAIGAGFGFWAAFFALFLGVLLALLGVVISLFGKTSRAIPFGPWLSLGALLYLWLAPDLLAYFQPAIATLWDMLTGRFP